MVGKESILDGVHVLILDVGGRMTYCFIHRRQPMTYYCMPYYKRVSINLYYRSDVAKQQNWTRYSSSFILPVSKSPKEEIVNE